ncbi:MAG: 30S ribosomal protein S11 [Parcubacteria group bacterium ADurb.Bin115]|jgi:small subunit ribosomal protein S11|nr:MAG: 30S ribosomal protein S11 [Parcubacteria group bacterium ADurb.Bin115]
MPEEKNLNSEEEKIEAPAATAKPAEAKAAAEESEDDRDESPDFSLDSGADEELPEEIKQKLEKNKQARAKKKLVKKRKKRTARTVKVGRAYINATYNNTMVTLTDSNGDVIAWASAGMAGFKGAKKATPYAAQIITKIAVQKAKEEYGLQEVSVFVAGVGTGREAAIRALNANGLEVSAIKDVTAVPHNGCRPKKPRRV